MGTRPNSKGVYFYSTGVLSALATAHTSLQGFFWLINPVASAKRVCLRRIRLHSTILASATMPAAPTITFQRMTFTGISSATPIVGVEAETRGEAPAGLLVPATTGLTPATVDANAKALSFFLQVMVNVTAAGVVVQPPVLQEWIPQQGEEFFIGPGEGIVCQQLVDGNASDARRFMVDLTTEEFAL